MVRSHDLGAFSGSIGLHVVLVMALLALRLPAHQPRQLVEFEVRPPKVVTPPPLEPPKLVQRRRPAAPPPPNAMKPPPKAEPPKPVFGVTADSTTDDSSFSVPIGNTTMIDPKESKPGPAPSLPAAPPAPTFQPVGDQYIREWPAHDDEACARGIEYPADARARGIEGTVQLRVELDDKGHIHDIKVTSGLGYGLDELAVNTLKHKRECKFGAAIGSDGKPVPFVIRSYRFNFQIDSAQ